MNLFELFEQVYYNGEITPKWSNPVDIVILKNPSVYELRRQFAKTSIPQYCVRKELRALLTEDALFVWDSMIAEHTQVTNTFGIAGMHLYIFENGVFKTPSNYLRHPDMKTEHIEYIVNHPVLTNIFGYIRPEVTDEMGFCFVGSRS